jgi:hypothetical protein
VDHGADAFVGEEFIDEDALLAAVEDVDAGNAMVAGVGGGDEEFAAFDVIGFEDGRDVGGADGVGGLSVNEDGFL